MLKTDRNCSTPANPDRRDFVRSAAGVLGASLVTGFPGIISGQTVTNAIKVGLVGCGGRGTGAASQALHADDYAELTAVADIAQSQVDAQPADIRKLLGKIAPRVMVETAQCFPWPGCVPEVDRQRRGRGAAGHTSWFPPLASGRLHRCQQECFL